LVENFLAILIQLVAFCKTKIKKKNYFIPQTFGNKTNRKNKPPSAHAQQLNSNLQNIRDE
jgi:hypothetical protein